MPVSPRPPIRHCPLCGLAMISSKSDEKSANFDTFACLNCNTVISLTPRRLVPSRSNERGLGLNSKPDGRHHYFASVLI
jgi:DNA-directed RNA polymerase subunit M/transcription elongation factor TFIIS